MPQDPFPLPSGDAEKPDGFPPPAAEGDWDGPAEEGWVDWDGPAEEGWVDWDGPAEQGLYLCLPPEQLTLAGFAQGGQADTMAPGPLLATVVHTVAGEDGTGLAGCSDDQLMGIISAARRMQSRHAWTEMAAMAEFAARHSGSRPADEFAPVELGFELHLTAQSAAEQMQYASAVADRLPATFAALAAGRIHPVHLRIIEDETRFLSDQDAAQADEMLAGQAPGMTYGEVRYAAHKLILQLDPDAARKRKEAARGEAHVRRFRENSGNAGMVARELPSDEVLASWQHVEQRALDLRAAGMPGTLQELRVRAYLDLLQERDSRGLPPAPAPNPDQSPSDSEPPDDEPGGPGPGAPSGPGGTGPAPGPGHPAGPSVAALVTLTIPLATYQGRSEVPGEADGFGPLDGDDARDLAAAAARHPATRWCLTALNPDGTAAAHGCLPARRPPPGPAPPGAPPGPAPSGSPPGPAPSGSPPGPAPSGSPPGPDPPGLAITMTPVAGGPCGHARAEAGYHPSRALQHLVRARNGRCTAPGCGRPAARCDLDHTLAWDQGGMTCECNLAPLCRRHHRAKQSEGWHLEQPEPGVLVWRIPAGRSYVTTPTEHPM